jgi:hypothetical protein
VKSSLEFDASITGSLNGRALDANGIVRDGELSAALRAAVHALASFKA